MPQSREPGFSLVRQHRRMLANCNFYLTPESRILDFGCGSGRQVYEYRDAGFDAYGFEIRPAPIFREPGDEKYFRFALTGKPADITEFEIHQASYRIPFDDGFFDFLFSKSSLEHVLDYDLAFAEMGRVLRPGGYAIHTFPARCSFREPHTGVPLGGVMRSYAWYLLWACLGVRNEYFRGRGAVECARAYFRYSRSGVNYPRPRDIRKAAERHFADVQFNPLLWELGDGGAGAMKASLLMMPVVRRFALHFYNNFFTAVLFLRK